MSWAKWVEKTQRLADLTKQNLQAISDQQPTRVIRVESLTPEHLADGFSSVRSNKVAVHSVVASSPDYVAIRRIFRSTDILDLECNAELLKMGLRGHLFGTPVFVDGESPSGNIFIIGAPGDQPMTHYALIKIGHR